MLRGYAVEWRSDSTASHSAPRQFRNTFKIFSIHFQYCSGTATVELFVLSLVFDVCSDTALAVDGLSTVVADIPVIRTRLTTPV